MVAQLNRLMSLFVLHGLLTQPVMATPDGYQTLVVNGDTLVVQMAEPLPAGYQTIVVDGDTLMVQVLAEPRLANESSLAASDDSLSTQTKAMETSPQAAIGDHANTTEESDRHLLDSIFMGDPFRSASAVSDSTERVERFPVQAGWMDDMDPDKRVATKLASGALVGGVGFAVGFALALVSEGDCDKDDNNDDPICGYSCCEELRRVVFGSTGYLIGTAVGVSQFDPRDRFIMSLGGSVVGLIGGIGLTSVDAVFWPSIFVGSVAFATVMSEWSRKSPQDRRVSFGLAPIPKGGLSASVTLRF